MYLCNICTIVSVVVPFVKLIATIQSKGMCHQMQVGIILASG